MEYNGEKLNLDNFRSVLSDFSVDVQDVVRSAVLDVVDVSEYLDSFKTDSYSLDQVRLALKEGLDVSEIPPINGRVMFELRRAVRGGLDFKKISSLIFADIDEEYFSYLLKWYQMGIDVSCVNLSKTPKNLLKVLDYGVQNGYNLSKFNPNVSCDPKIVKYFIMIETLGRDSTLLYRLNLGIEELKLLFKKAGELNNSQWKEVCAWIERVKRRADVRYISAIVSCVRNNMKVDWRKKRYSTKQLEYAIEAYERGVDYEKVLNEELENKAKEVLIKLQVEQNKQLSGRLGKR